jgi:hypothetical protein
MSSLARRDGMRRYYQAHQAELKTANRNYYRAHAEKQAAATRARYKQIKNAILSYATTDPESLFAEDMA